MKLKSVEDQMTNRSSTVTKEEDGVDVLTTDLCNKAFLSQNDDCPHLSKGTNFSVLRKFYKDHPFYKHCHTCQKGGLEKQEDEDSFESSIWICLYCGIMGCGRFSEFTHSLKHYETPRSSLHCLVLNLSTWEIWCYKCDKTVDSSSPKLHDVLEFIRKQMRMRSNSAKDSRKSSKTDSSIYIEDPATIKLSSCGKQSPDNIISASTSVSSSVSVAQVKGLSNLGNTCFFNSVMQNIAQTPSLKNILQNLLSTFDEKDAFETLPGGNVHLDIDSIIEESSESDESKPMVLEPLRIKVSEPGLLTECLSAFMTDMDSDSKSRMVVPGNLFSLITKKVDRFKGYRQQDSHELLRELLENIRLEEQKRRQNGILSTLNVSSSKVDDLTKARIKAYGQQCKHTFVDSLFGGQMLSSVTCKQCGVTSARFEPFLDLSLSLNDDKVVKRNSLRPLGQLQHSKISQSDDNSCEENSEARRELSINSLADNKSSKSSAKQSRRSSQNNGDDEDYRREDNIKSTGTSSFDRVKNCAANYTSTEDLDVTISASGPHCFPQDSSGKRDRFDSRSSLESSCEFNAEFGCNSNTPLSSLETSSSNERSSKGLPHRIHNEDVTRSSGEIATASKVQRSSSVESGEELLGECSYCHEVHDALWGRCALSRTRLLRRVRCITDFAVQRLFPSLRRPLPSDGSLECLLEGFFASEELKGKNRYLCAYCNRRKDDDSDQSEKQLVYTDAVKHCAIFSPPAVLTIHLKRFEQDHFRFRKANKHVNFPALLDLAPYCSFLVEKTKVNQEKLLYSLFGIVCHAGSMGGGHYIAYVKSRCPVMSMQAFMSSTSSTNLAQPSTLSKLERLMQERSRLDQVLSEEINSCDSSGMDKAFNFLDSSKYVVENQSYRWYYVSDSSVREVSEKDVFSSQAYLLFYERVY